MIENLGERIKNIREERNLSQRRFGKKIGISDKTISAYETGKIIPSLQVLQEIEAKYSVAITSTIDRRKKDILLTIDTLRKQLEDLEKRLEHLTE